MNSAILIVLFAISNIYALKPCPGDTRGDKRCNHDPTHRVCAKVSSKIDFWSNFVKLQYSEIQNSFVKSSYCVVSNVDTQLRNLTFFGLIKTDSN